MSLTDEVLAELEAKHRRIIRVDGKRPPATAANPDPKSPWTVVYRAPKRAEYKRFRSMAHNPGQVADAQEVLARACVVYPDAAAFDALLEEYPAIPEASGAALGELAGVAVDESSK